MHMVHGHDDPRRAVAARRIDGTHRLSECSEKILKKSPDTGAKKRRRRDPP
jgi:hypothetical protein